MNIIEHKLKSMFNIKSEFVEQSGSLYKDWKRRAKIWLKVMKGRGPAAHLYRDYYSPAPRNWNNLPSGNVYEKLIAKNEAAYLSYVKTCAQYHDHFANIPVEQANTTDPFWSNPAFSPLDSLVLYSLIAHNNPSVYMEVGSGNSTKYARRAIKDHGLQTKIIAVEPFPRPELEEICDELCRAPAEALPVEKFAELNSGDVLFIDNSHRSFQNSDVTFFFTEILPNLKPGVIYGIHDIFLPNDYPGEWAMRFYNEQYLLMMYLLGGAGGDSILFPVAYMSYRKEVEETLLGGNGKGAPWGNEPLQGGAFWMVKA